MKILIVILCTQFGLARADNVDAFTNWFVEQKNEIIDVALDVPLRGEIPDYVKGKLIRLGPSVLNTRDKNYTNYLDAFGRISSWTISGDTNAVHFQSAILKSLLWNHSVEQDSIARHISQEKTDPSTSPGVFNLDDMDNTDVNVYKFPGSDTFLTLTDFHLMNEIDVSSLRTLGTAQHDDDLPGTVFFSSSHPAEYSPPGSSAPLLINWLGAKTARGSTIYLYSMGSDLRRTIIGSVDMSFLPYSIHSVTVAGDFAVVQTGPVGLDFMRTGLNLCISCSADDNMATQPTQIFIFSLLQPGGTVKGGRYASPVGVVEVPPPAAFFSYHFVNSFVTAHSSPEAAASESKEGQSLVLDMCAYYSMAGLLGQHVLGDLADVFSQSTRDTMPNQCDVLKRLEISLDSFTVTRNADLPLRDKAGNVYRVELVSVSPLVRGDSSYCYAYAASNHVLNSSRYEDMGVLKIDMCAADAVARGHLPPDTATVVGVWHEEGVYVGEPVFVPSGGNGPEDEGTLLVVTREGSQGTSSLRFIDATSLQEVARSQAPFPLMFEFHGQFFPEDTEK
jgi:carotenoid cleavage dioxygenase-like enzyme